MKIIAKQDKIEKEIEILSEKIDSLDEKTLNLKKEISLARKVILGKRDELFEVINFDFSNKKIDSSISKFFKILNELYLNKYYCQLIKPEIQKKFEKALIDDIKTRSIEEIISQCTFQHNSWKMKFKSWMFIMPFLGLTVFEIYFTISRWDSWMWQLQGTILSASFWLAGIAGILIVSVGAMILVIPNLPSKYVLQLIENEKEGELQTLLNYLNSIHKLPKEIKTLIK